MSAAACGSRRRVEDRPVAASAELEEMCHVQVEHYQPLYGVRGLDGALRECRDRALTIESALAPLGPRMRLIDFGSSLGYFPFFFADRGAQATGVDINPRNTAVAQACQRLNGLPATFATGALDLPSVRAIAHEAYDVALVLSVLHHIVAGRGMDHVVQLVAELHQRVPNLVLELAHRDEDVPFAWRAALPEDPLAVLDGCGPVRIRELARSQSHLSASTRPLYLVTR